MKESALKYSKTLIFELFKSITAWCLIVPPFVLILPFLTFYNLIVTLIVRVLYPDLKPTTGLEGPFIIDKLAENDKVYYDYERNPLNTVGFCFEILEDKVDLQEFRVKVQKTLVDQENDFGWRFKHYLVRFCGYTFWKNSPNFLVSNHVRQIRLPLGENALDFLNLWATKPYEFRTPLWEFLILDTESTQYIAFKCHHSLGDGLTLCEISNSVFEAEHHPIVQEIFAPNSAAPKVGFLTMIYLILRTPGVILEFITKLTKKTDAFQIKTGIKPEQFTSVQTMNLDLVKSISKNNGVGLLSVLLAIYAGGIQRFLQKTERSISIPDSLLVPVPQPWPGRPKNFIGNHWNTVFLEVPLTITDPIEKVKQIQAQISYFYSSGNFLILKYVILYIWKFIPTSLVRYFINKSPAHCSLSPLLCPDEYKYNGNKLKLVHGIAGIVTPTFGILCGTLSHKNEIIWTTIGAKDFFKTKAGLDTLTNTCFMVEFKDLCLASDIN